MIAPDFRRCAPINLKQKAQPFIEKNHGTDLFKQLENSFGEMDSVKADLCNAHMFKADPEQLKKYMNLFAKHYTNAKLLNKYFSFGTS